MIGELVAVGEKGRRPLEEVVEEVVVELMEELMLFAVVVMVTVLLRLALELELALLKERSMMPVTRSLQPAVMSVWSTAAVAVEAEEMVRPKLLLLLLLLLVVVVVVVVLMCKLEVNALWPPLKMDPMVVVVITDDVKCGDDVLLVVLELMFSFRCS